MKLLDENTVDEALMFAGKGIEYWFRYYQVVGKGGLLNEDSIKYPVVEYLIADGDDSLKNIILEDKHPVFTTREVDLISKDSTGKNNYCIEFKLASKLTMNPQERQRIFDDIARLNFANQKGIEAYFIIAGKTIEFLTEFRSITDKTPGIRGPHKKKIDDDKKKVNFETPSGFYSDKWFSFDLSIPDKIVDIEEDTESVHAKHYEEFKKTYLIDEHSDLKLKNFKTVLKYITEIKKEDTTGNIPAMVGIWQIINSNE